MQKFVRTVFVEVLLATIVFVEALLVGSIFIEVLFVGAVSVSSVISLHITIESLIILLTIFAAICCKINDLFHTDNFRFLTYQHLQLFHF